MKLKRYRSARDFEAATRAFLVANEAANNLILGLTHDLVHTDLYRDHLPYLAAVAHAGEVVAATLRTPPHNIHISLAPPEAVALIAADVQWEHTDLPGAQGAEEVSLAFAREWQQLTGRRYQPGIPQRIYEATAVTPPDGVPGEMRPATREYADLLLDWLVAFDVEMHGGPPNRANAERRFEAAFKSTTRGLFVWHDGEPVALAGFGGQTPNGIRVGPVYTPPEHRRRGYATALTAALTCHLLDQGRRACFLFTNRNNATTNHIYQQIGYRPVVDVNEYRFVDGD